MKTLHLNIQDDITPKEAACLSVLLAMIMKGINHPLTNEIGFAVSIDQVNKLYEASIRHWQNQPEPVVDEAGVKHYGMECETGKFGLQTQSVQ